MADDVRIDIPDLDDFVRRHAGAEQIVQQELKRAGDRSGVAVQRRVVQRVKKKTRHLAQSVAFATVVQGFAVTTRVGTKVPYGRYLDEGTGIYGPKKRRITPKTAKVLAGWTYEGAPVFARSVKGIPGDKWFTGGWQEERPNVRREFQHVPKRIINRVRKGGSA